MKYYSLCGAEKATGVHRGTISKALKDGTLSYFSKTEKGYQIEASELNRVFPLLEIKQPTTTVEMHDWQPTATHAENEAMKTEIRMLREMLEQERRHSEKLYDQLNRTTALLTDMREKEKAPEEKKGFWQRITG